MRTCDRASDGTDDIRPAIEGFLQLLLIQLLAHVGVQMLFAFIIVARLWLKHDGTWAQREARSLSVTTLVASRRHFIIAKKKRSFQNVSHSRRQEQAAIWYYNSDILGILTPNLNL